MNDHHSAVAEAFSRKSLVYDSFGEGHPNLERMRKKVRSHVLKRLQTGDRILEINAGTGADAAYFAGLGWRVHATDLSPGMVSRIEMKRIEFGLNSRLTVQQCDYHQLDETVGGSYDYVFSNMGGINCALEIKSVANGVSRLLKASGLVTWVVMPQVCLWELGALLRGDFQTAIRRFHQGGVYASVDGVNFLTHYYSPNAVRAAFGEDFETVELEGLSVFTPPADHKEFPFKHPLTWKLLQALDDRLARYAPFNQCGDFYILTVRRKQK